MGAYYRSRPGPRSGYIAALDLQNSNGQLHAPHDLVLALDDEHKVGEKAHHCHNVAVYEGEYLPKRSDPSGLADDGVIGDIGQGLLSVSAKSS